MSGISCRNDRSRRDFFRFGTLWRAILALALVLLLLLVSSTQLPLVLGHAHGKTFQAWASAPPTINGEIGDSEWEKAASSVFSVTIGGNPYSGTFYAMNDATNLYIGIKIADDDFNSGAPTDAVGVYFDNDNDGTFEPNDDGLAEIAGATGFLDRFLQVIPTMQLDTDFGGTTDGSGACAGHAGYNHFELSHPLNSADDAHDFSLNPMNTVGFTILYQDAGVGQDYWPALATADATGWGDIVIAAAPPSMSAWASAAPTVDGTIGGAEWGSASHVPIAIGWGFVGDLWVMNDADNMYLAVKIADGSLSASDNLWISFDNNNNGVVDSNEDLLFVSGGSTFVDAFWDATHPEDDTLDGGTSDGQGAASGSGGFNYFEMRHPLDSADNSHDFSLTAGSAVAFSVEYIEASGYWGDWPSQNAKGWADIVVASSPAPTPDFLISSDPTAVSVSQGASNSATIIVESVASFSSPVALSVSWLGAAPSGVTTSLPSPITPTAGGTATSTLTVATSPSASIGMFTLQVTGESGALSHAVDVTIEVTPGAADFTITVAPDSLSLSAGTSGTATVTVQSIGVFSAPVDLSSSGAPSGLSLVFGTNPVLPPAGEAVLSILTVSVAGAPTGTHVITITGTGGALTRSTTLTVEITGVGGGCLIATATYGSELSEEVQFLRTFRDKSILQTRAGSSFMAAFNAWYYSFSPTVAELIREHEALKTTAKFILYPLIGILRLGAATFDLFPDNSEVGAVLSGLVVSSLIGVAYVTAPLVILLAYSSRARRITRRLQPSSVIIFVALAALVIVSVLGGPAIPMMVATSAMVLASIVASALLASRVILRAVRPV